MESANFNFLYSSMFWSGRVSGWSQLLAAWKGKEVALVEDLKKPDIYETRNSACAISVATTTDSAGISNLLNESFEGRTSRAETAVTPAWVRSTFLKRHALWIVAKDPGGTIRGCVVSFACPAPYLNSLGGCGGKTTWGVVDWFCVHPLWREKGIGSALLETLDYITHTVGRKAHVFIKEGFPLASQLPVYGTVYWVRKAGRDGVTAMRPNAGLSVWPFQANERETGLPLIRVEGVRGGSPDSAQLKDWEDALDTELPPCWVFVTSVDKRDPGRGWVFDSLVWMYAFRWTAGRFLGDPPNPEIL
jgi:GNAT superfamily N-acetyltransferase